MINVGSSKKIPARCNKRACQARRNLSKRPENCVRGRPKCHINGCDGLMYVDQFRLDARTDRVKRIKDTGDVCRDDCLPYPHRKGCKGCKHHTEYVLEQSLKAPARHRPFPPGYNPVTDDRCPF